MPGTPYSIGSGSSVSGGNVAVAVGHAVGVGDLIFVALHTSGGGTPSVNDSQGNSYTHLRTVTGAGVTQSSFACFATTALTTSDTITVVNSALTAAADVGGCSGLTTVDLTPVGGSSTASSAAYSVNPNYDASIAFLFFANRHPFTPPPENITGNPTPSGGQPTSWGSPLNSQTASDLEAWLYAAPVDSYATAGAAGAVINFTAATGSMTNIDTFYLPGVTYAPASGQITLTGGTPTAAQVFSPPPGHISLSGGIPTLTEGSPPFDPLVTVISQYANSPIMLALIESFAAAEDPTGAINDFYSFVWNVSTAKGYGLDVWGRIVGVERVVQIPSGTFFSFVSAGNPGVDNFGGGPFYSGDEFTNNFSLTDPAFLQLILAKAAANICDGSIPAINEILMALFPGLGNCYVTDGENMTMTYTFGGTLSPVDHAIITQTGALPKPVGVALTVVEL